MLNNIIADADAALTWPARCWPVVIPVAFVISCIATLLCEKIAPRLGVVDKPDNLVKTHKRPTPYLGGVAILIGLIGGMLASLPWLPEWYCGPEAFKWTFGLLAAGAVACVVGCLDDIFDIRPWQKITGQIIAAIVLVAVGITPTLYSLSWPAKLAADTVFVVVFVLGATNSLNLLDGLDGLCAGVTAVMTAAMLALAALMATKCSYPGCAEVGSEIVILCLALLASVLGFLIFNYHPARIFMGDAGSLLLGLNMATLMIMFSKGGLQFWLASIVIFGLPILDTAVAFARRIINKKPLFVSDRGHIYDQMMDRGMTVRKTVNLCYAFAALYAVAGLAVSRMPIPWATAVCLAIVIISALIVWRKGYLKMEGLRGAHPSGNPGSADHTLDDRIR